MKTDRNLLKVSLIFLAFYIICSAYYFKRVYQPWGTCDTDFTVFVRAARSLSQKENIYTQSYLETGKDYYKYSPAFAMAMIPLSRLHMHLSVPIWFLLIYIFFIGTIFLTQKILQQEDKNRVASRAFFLFGILMSLRFLLSVVQRVQSDCLVLILLSLFALALFHKREWLSGVALASAVMVKLTPLIFLPYLMLRKRWKAALATLAGILFYLWLPALYLGWDKNIEFLKSWLAVHKTNPADYLFWYKNQSLLSCLSRFLSGNTKVGFLHLSQAGVNIIFLLTAAALFFLVFFCIRNSKRLNSPLLYLVDISLISICMVLFSPLGWKHTFVHLLIAHLVVLYYLFYVAPRDRTVKALVLLSFFLNTVLNPEMTKPIAQLVQLFSTVTFGTLCLYAALLMIGCRYANIGDRSHI